MTARIDTYHGIRRLWVGGSVYTGLVSVPGARGYSRYEVRCNGEVVRRVYGLSRRTLDYARQVSDGSMIGSTATAVDHPNLLLALIK
jgi:hypothetical protein